MATATIPTTVPEEWDRRLTSREERYAAGKALRSIVPRSSHAEWVPDPERPDPISMLEQANSTRLEHLVPIRYGRMSMSPFAFYRGSANIMAYDLAKTPVSGIRVQLCGDAHLSNFGVYASPERRSRRSNSMPNWMPRTNWKLLTRSQRRLAFIHSSRPWR